MIVDLFTWIHFKHIIDLIVSQSHNSELNFEGSSKNLSLVSLLHIQSNIWTEFESKFDKNVLLEILFSDFAYCRFRR